MANMGVIVLSSDDDEAPPVALVEVDLNAAAPSDRKRKSEAERLQPFAFDKKRGKLGPAWDAIQPGKARERKWSSPKGKFGDYATDSMIEDVLSDVAAAPQQAPPVLPQAPQLEQLHQEVAKSSRAEKRARRHSQPPAKLHAHFPAFGLRREDLKLVVERLRSYAPF